MLAQQNKSISLYEAEDTLLAMMETEEFTTPELEREFHDKLTKTLTAVVDKRESVGRFILQLEGAAKFAREEVKRIEERARFWERAAKRLRGYVLNVIQEIGPNAKGDLPKLQGHTLTMSARATPASVEIKDGALIPVAYKYVELMLTGEEWMCIKSNFPEGILKELEPRLTWNINNAALKAALKRGEIVPGAELLVGGNTLQVS